MGKLPFFRTKANTAGAEHQLATLMTSHDHTRRLRELERTLASVRATKAINQDEIASLVADDENHDVLPDARAMLTRLETQERELLAGIERVKARHEDALRDEARKRLTLSLRNYTARLVPFLERTADVIEAETRLEEARRAKAMSIDLIALDELYNQLRDAGINVQDLETLVQRRDPIALRAQAQEIARHAARVTINADGSVDPDGGEEIDQDRLPATEDDLAKVRAQFDGPEAEYNRKARVLDSQIAQAKRHVKRLTDDPTAHQHDRERASVRVEELETERRTLRVEYPWDNVS